MKKFLAIDYDLMIPVGEYLSEAINTSAITMEHDDLIHIEVPMDFTVDSYELFDNGTTVIAIPRAIE
jgi:hypothetical protein